MTDLETATMDELWEEIAKRCDHAILHIIRPREAASPDRDPHRRGTGREQAFWIGDRYTCIGLCRTLEELFLQQEVREDAESGEEVEP